TVHVLPGKKEVTHVALTADGTHLGWVESGRTIRVLQLNQAEPSESIELQQFALGEPSVGQFGLFKNYNAVTVVYTSGKELFTRELDVSWALAYQDRVVLDQHTPAFLLRQEKKVVYQPLSVGATAPVEGLNNERVLGAVLSENKLFVASRTNE